MKNAKAKQLLLILLILNWLAACGGQGSLGSAITVPASNNIIYVDSTDEVKLSVKGAPILPPYQSSYWRVTQLVKGIDGLILDGVSIIPSTNPLKPSFVFDSALVKDSGYYLIEFIEKKWVYFYNPKGTSGWDFEDVDSVAWLVYVGLDTQSPPTWQGSFVATSQADLERLQGFEEINGNLMLDNILGNAIQLDSSINSLAPLSELRVVQGNFEIKEEHELSNLQGLENLQQVNGDFDLYGVQSLEGIEKLEQINGDFFIYGAQALEGLGSNLSVAGTFHINSFEGTSFSAIRNTNLNSKQLQIRRNPNITTLDGLESVSVGNAGSITIRSNESLESLIGFPLSLTGSNEFDMDITGNAALVDINPLSQIQELGKLNIEKNPNIASLEALGALESVRQFTIVNNQNLETLGLSSLTTVGGTFNISGNNSLTSLEGLESLQSIKSDFNVTQNATLFNFVGLSRLEFILGGLIVKSNDSLMDFTGLGSLARVSGCLCADANENLNSLEGLSALTSVYNIDLDDNPTLTSLNGLDQITSLNDLTLSSLPSISSIEQLSNLQSVESLVIRRLNKLQSLKGLENFTEANRVSLSGNKTLQDIQSLINFANPAARFEVAYNGNLCQNDVDTLLADIGISGGNIDTYSNLVQCIN